MARGDYGSVFYMKVEDPTGVISEGTFMVIRPSAIEDIRAQKPQFRQAICLNGAGYWAYGQIARGELVPVVIDDSRMEWLTDD